MNFFSRHSIKLRARLRSAKLRKLWGIILGQSADSHAPGSLPVPEHSKLPVSVAGGVSNGRNFMLGGGGEGNESPNFTWREKFSWSCSWGVLFGNGNKGLGFLKA